MNNCKELTSAVKAAAKNIRAAEKAGLAENANAVCARITANAYYYKRKLYRLEKDLDKLKALPAKNGMPFVFSRLWNTFKQKGFVCDKSVITEGLKGYDCGSYELDMLGVIINAAAIIEIGLVCESAFKHKSYSLNRLQAAHDMLKKAEVTDFSTIYACLSSTERLLLEKEPYYGDMTDATKGAYRKALRRRAKAKGLTEKAVLEKAVADAEKNGTCIGRVINADSKGKPLPYLVFTLAVFAAVMGAVFWLCPLWAALLLVIPIGAFALGLADFCFSMLTVTRPCPAVAAEKLPKGDLTLTVITTLLEEDSDAFDALERFFITNNEEGLYYGILADLPAAKTPTAAQDEPLLTAAAERIRALNARFGERFCLFVRRRTAKGENGKWNGRERKRGAIEDLVRYLRGSSRAFLLTEGAKVKNVKFLLTLDSDTNLPPGGAAAITGMLLHPLNKAVIQNGRVKEGYGILQPAVQTSLKSSKATAFAAMLAGVGGIDVYESAAFNRQQSIFGEGVFCGKGLIDIDAYARLLDGVLPDGRVLSHDMPEGNILRTRYVSDLCFTDNVPSNVLGYYFRLHRWIRGDTQNLSLLKGYRQGVRGGLRIVQNVLRHLCPVFAFAALGLASFMEVRGGLWVCFFALVNLLAPVFYTVISRPAALRFRTRRFFSAVQSGTVQSVSTAFYELCALCHKTVITVNATTRAVTRLITRKGLLSWVTAAQAEKSGEKGVFTFVYHMFPATVLGSLFFFFSGLWVTRLLGLFWFLFPVYSFYMSRPIQKRNEVSEPCLKSIKSKALPIWRFFEDNVNEKTAYLPPDNIQMAPVEAVAMRTSPTNIGLYLLSVVAAEDFGFIDAAQSEARIDKALDAIERMEKWKGHLYNWYSLGELKVLGGGYVSTVDSGNLCVCLVALARSLYSGGRTRNAKRAEALYEAADFTALYNGERNLFSLGYDSATGTLSDICYDLFMSEARSTSYFALAFGQAPIKHWRALGRPMVGSGGHIGMASWSGTAFEYFMPQLFLPLYKDSFIYESMHFALNEQKRFSYGKLWGCSESAYFCFDADMNYQYKAHGVQSLALMHYTEKETVLSPYSVYLSMCIAPMGAVRTLNTYETALGKGVYGLYEAVDCTGGAVVQSYMAHHMGMSLIACANACFDGVFVKRFMNHPRTAAFYELLQEKIPVGANIFEAERQRPAARGRGPIGSFTQRLTEYNSGEPVFHVSGTGANTVVADSAGHVRFAAGDVSVNEVHFTPYSAARTFSVLFCSGKEVYSAAPYGGTDGKFSFESAAGYGAHICSSPRFSGRVKYYTDAAGCFVTETKSDGGKSYCLVFGFDVQLATDKQFFAHPAFSRLFVTASYDKERNALIYAKNSSDGKERLYLAVGLSDSGLSFGFETNKDSYRAFSLYHPKDMLKESYTNTTGVCVTPFCLIKTPPIAGGEIRLIIAVGRSKEECLERLEASRRGRGAPVGSAVFGERENPLLSGIFYGKGDTAKTDLVSQGALWGHGVSGDYPIIAVLVREYYQKDLLFYLRIFKKLAAFNIRTELVLLVCEDEKYSAPAKSAIKRLIRAEKCENFVGRRGGIFFADGDNGDTVDLFKDVADYFTESFDTPFADRADGRFVPQLPKIIRSGAYAKQVSGYKVCGGVYENGLFTVDKDAELKLPFSYILAGKGFGSVVTHGSLGYSFYGNAALRRIGAFAGDIYGGTDTGEVIYCFENEKVYDLAACAAEVVYGQGLAVYKGTVAGREYRLTVFVCERLPLKVIRVRFEDGEDADIAYCVKPLMGSGVFPAKGVSEIGVSFKEGTALGFRVGKSAFFGKHVGIIACLGAGQCFTKQTKLFCGDDGGRNDVFAVRHQGKSAVFVLGAAPTADAAARVLRCFAKHGVDTEEAAARRFADSMLPPIRMACKTHAAAEMFNRFAPYQTAACRFFARGAFYQSSGAYGFRDQLQDCLYLVYSMPKTVRTHILRCGARQYTDGSVQHWWHPTPKDGKTYGVRSKCSDDFLWLPICVAEYIEKTGDESILRVELPYLNSAELGAEKERYEAAEATKERESLYMHCVRALEHGKNYGRHGLPLMGSCDWNDAFSAMGDGAESVFCCFLYVVALKRFAAVARNMGDADYADRCLREAAELLKRGEACFVNDRFVRAYTGSGDAVGVPGRAACEIDILAQAFAVFAGADKAKCKTAMATAYSLLYDKENKLLKLFSPPFGADTEYAGYINAYAKGVRENGGQYTHAAVWFAAALAMCGMKEEALELITAINPLWRAEDGVLFSKYKAEPYAIAADIYTARGQSGRGGWTFYTGAAGWYCKVMLEQIMGISFSKGNTLVAVKPLFAYDAVLELCGKLHISVTADASLSMDGKKVNFPIVLDGGEHYLTVPLEN